MNWNLTPRQREIIRWTAEGKNSVEVGRLLGIKPQTVKNHILLIRQRLDLNGVAQLARWAERNGIVTA